MLRNYIIYWYTLHTLHTLYSNYEYITFGMKVKSNLERLYKYATYYPVNEEKTDIDNSQWTIV